MPADLSKLSGLLLGLLLSACASQPATPDGTSSLPDEQADTAQLIYIYPEQGPVSAGQYYRLPDAALRSQPPLSHSSQE